MAVRTIIHLPDERLRERTKLINNIADPEIQTLIDDMIETMYAADGVGLAATQIGLDKRIAVLDASKERNKPMVLINPEIIAREGEELMSEGCLSVPGFYDKAPRALKVTLRAFDRDGKQYEIEADGLLAHVIQHECDHLDGKLFIDYLSPLKRQMARKKLDKHKRRNKN
jgi:peptide deformylase